MPHNLANWLKKERLLKGIVLFLYPNKLTYRHNDIGSGINNTLYFNSSSTIASAASITLSMS